MTGQPVQLSIIIPCFNEAARLGSTLDEVLAWARARGSSFEVIVADDGSTDGTAELVSKRAGATGELRLVRLGQNSGKGAAVRAGMLAARGERCAFVDADGATPIAEMAELEAALEAGADVAVGSRVLDASRVDALVHRRALGSLFRMLVRMLAVRSVEDTQCGFKLFRRSAVEPLFGQQAVPRFGFDVEVLARAERLGLRIVEVPVRWRERPGSKVHVLRDGLAMSADVFRIRRLLGPGSISAASHARADVDRS